MAEWSKATDCKSVEVFLRRFESCLSHLFVVDFRERRHSSAEEGQPAEKTAPSFLAVP